MALATQCPHCQTIFRVANDQLKLRAGLVRCGACREVFNGIEHLVRPGHATSGDSNSFPSTSQHGNPSPTATWTNERSAPIAPPLAISAPMPLPTPPAPEIVSPRASNPLPNNTATPTPVDTFHAAPNYSAQPAAEQPIFGETKESPSIQKVPSPYPHFAPPSQIDKESAYSPTPASALQSEFAEKRQEVSPIPAASSGYAVQKLHVTVPLTSSPNVWHRHVNAIPTNVGDSASEDPLQRMTLFQIEPGALDGTDYSADDDELDRLIDELQNRPWRGKKQNAPGIAAPKVPDVILGEARDTLGEKAGNRVNEYSTPPTTVTEDSEDIIAEPRFMQEARRKQRVGGAIRTSMWLGCVLLLITLIGQAGYTFRNQLAASLPPLKPALQRACNYLGCKIGLPMNIDGISIDANDLQLIVPARNQFALSVLMRNRNSSVQAWPNIELTLNDTSEKAIARRVFTPTDYLPATINATNATLLTQGFARNTEQSVKLTFELSQLKASGYRVYLFYP
ncbi:DUF3426 domain-containing protein [Glaciimonas sp. PCH181]|uniref:DUF3426 domain-containing protein n=1 Tax=Glaciimonas sp. PCH181 TaxID=2133943 RepID=UPI000D3460F3|nr:DUF3426 domain-containing protein [Glaciimonas sp. PCH181]PUA20556.1 hypothetical protein C7W93_12655 [Glaciimonas sp. PCH181]